MKPNIAFNPKLFGFTKTFGNELQGLKLNGEIYTMHIDSYKEDGVTYKFWTLRYDEMSVLEINQGETCAEFIRLVEENSFNDIPQVFVDHVLSYVRKMKINSILTS